MLKLLWFICFFNDSCSKLTSLLKIITWMLSLLWSKHKSPLTVQQQPPFIRTLFVPAQPQGQLSLWATLKLLLSLLLQEEERGQSSPTTPNARLYYVRFQQLKQEAVVGSVKTILLIVNGWLVNPCQHDWIWNDLGDAALPVSYRTLAERFDKASWLDWDTMPNKGGRVGSSWACSLLTVSRYRTTRGLLSTCHASCHGGLYHIWMWSKKVLFQ